MSGQLRKRAYCRQSLAADTPRRNPGNLGSHAANAWPQKKRLLQISRLSFLFLSEAILAIVNLTQHPATAEQKAAGVADLPAEQRAELQQLLTFDAPPTAEDISARAHDIAELACYNGLAEHDSIQPDAAMIGGALWLMAPLAEELRARGVKPVFAFTRREAEEQPQADGSVKKVAVFRHAGFVEAV